MNWPQANTGSRSNFAVNYKNIIRNDAHIPCTSTQPSRGDQRSVAGGRNSLHLNDYAGYRVILFSYEAE